jgi:hypothetical protein
MSSLYLLYLSNLYYGISSYVTPLKFPILTCLPNAALIVASVTSLTGSGTSASPYFSPINFGNSSDISSDLD